MLRVRTSFNKYKLWHHNFIPALKLWTKSIKKLWIIDINVSKLTRIYITYAISRQNNRFKWFKIYVYLPIHYGLREYNTTNLSVGLTGRYRLWPEARFVLRRFWKREKRQLGFSSPSVRIEQLVSHNKIFL
jgi:hypothetical protein